MSENSNNINPFLAASNSKKMLTLISVYLGVMANLMVSSTNATLLPIAAGDLGGMEIYGLAQSISGVLGVCAMPIFGFIGARKPYLKRSLVGGGLATGALVILARAIATNYWVIIIANIFWGLVSAGVFVVGFTMIRDMYDQKKAGFYLGLNGTMMSIAMIAGPLVGGVVIDQIGWRVWSWMVFALLAAAFVMVQFFGIKATKEQTLEMAVKGGSFDFAGGAAVTVFLAMLILTLSLGGSYVPFGSSGSNMMVVIGIISLICLVVIVRKKGNDAVVPLDAVKDRNTLVFSACNLLHNLGQMSITFFVPAFVMMQLIGDPIVESLGPAVAGGLVTVALAFLGLFLGPVWGKMIAKDGSAKRAMTIANVSRIVVMVGLLLFLVPTTPAWVIYLIVLIAGIYNSNMTVAMSAGPQIQLKPELRVTGNSLVQLGQNLGAGIGVALFTVLIGVDPVHGMTICIVISLVCFIVLTLITFLLKKNSPIGQSGEAPIADESNACASE